MTVSPKIPSDRDLELLYAYLDGELTDREKELLEQRLARENALRAELDDLRETVALVSDLPRLKAPRNFTLDPAVYGRPVRRRIFTLTFALRFSGALGAAASIVLIMLAVLLTQGGSEKSSLSGEHLSSESPPIAMQPTLAEVQPEETALAYAGNDLLQTTMAAQSLYYATLEPTLTQAALDMAAPAGEESYQDTTTAPTEVAQEMAAGAVAPAESEAPPAPANEEPSTLMMQPGAYPPAAAQDAVGGAGAPPPAPALAPTATAVPAFAAPQPVTSASGEGFRESQRDDNTDEGDTDGSAANSASNSPTSSAEVMLVPTATPAPATQAEKSQPDETPVEAQTARRQTTSDESSSYWWLAGIGLVTLAVSIALFVWGGRGTRA
jgi:anti-sigma factor RsiW